MTEELYELPDQERMRDLSMRISNMFEGEKIHPEFAMGVMATTLAIYCMANGLSKEQAVKNFTLTTHHIYNPTNPRNH